MPMKLLTLLVTTALASMGAHAAVTDQMIENDAKSTGDVLSWGIGPQGQRYSPLKQINADTIGKLVPAWSFSFGGEKQRGQETQPLIHDGKMFVTASYSRLFALDAKTGEKLWKYEHRLPDGIMPCCDVINRGAVLYDNLVILATLDAQLVALDQKTGEVVWKEKIDDYAAGYSATAAPLIAQGLLVTGVSGGEFGVVGRVEARNPKTGQIVWHYQGTPNDGWDFDGVNEFVTYDDGGKVLGGKADRNGFFYVMDAKSGKLENAFPFVKKVTWATGIDLKTGRPNFVPDKRPGDPTAGADGKKGKVVFAAPSFLGGKNQMPMAYSPDTKLFYVPANEWGMEIWNEPITYKKGAAYLGAGFTIKTLSDGPIGALRAIDPKTGNIVWEAPNNAPLWGGVLTTGGNLVFWGTPEGYLQAADAKTGKVVWKFQTGSGVVAPPVTWEDNGEQYIAVASGWGGAVPLWGGDVAKRVNYLEQGGSMWVFKLPK